MQDAVKAVILGDDIVSRAAIFPDEISQEGDKLKIQGIFCAALHFIVAYRGAAFQKTPVGVKGETIRIFRIKNIDYILLRQLFQAVKSGSADIFVVNQKNRHKIQTSKFVRSDNRKPGSIN